MKRIKIAIQKSGRLNEKSIQLLTNCGLKFENYKSSLISQVSNFPMEILFLRDDDIPGYVQDGIADIGIVGENIVKETQADAHCLQRLGFGKCSLKIAIPNESNLESVQELNGMSIATSYPNILKTFLDEYNISAQIRTISGSVEISPGLGLSDAIFDIVSTGGTLKSNGLKPIIDVISSEALLIGKAGMENHPVVQELLLRIQSVLRAQETKYVVMNVEKVNVQKVVELLPGIKSPTVVDLADAGWVAVHTAIPEKDFWDKISKLKAAGAQGIVVMPIEKIII
jgi:ATP phosphoribosyltransferase